jgi:hypothetical protein
MLSYRARRFWEILPGVTTWTILIMPFVLSIVAPVGLAYFVIIFDVYWLTNAIVMGAHLWSGFVHMRRAMRIDWLARLRGTGDLPKLAAEFKAGMRSASGFEARKLHDEWQEVEQLMRLPETQKPWESVLHAVIYAVYKEDYELVKASVAACLASNYPSDKILLVLALEERAGQSAQAVGQRIKEEFAGQFYDVIVTTHPDGIVGEIKAKGANVYHAGRELQKYIDAKGVAYDDVIVSCFDADTLPSRQYFANLAYKYVINPERVFRSFQPIPLFNNNMWDVPMMNRLVAFGSSYWQIIESTRPHRLINFSSQAMSLKTLVDIDFWDRSVVSEDSKQFYRAFYHYNGNHKVVPIFAPVSMDAVLGKDYWDTMRAQYIQKRRWAWGIEHFSYTVETFITMRGALSFYQRWIHPYRIYVGHVAWGTASLLIAMGAWMPILLNSDFRSSILAYHLPVLARDLLSLTWLGIVLQAGIAMQLLPPRPAKYGKTKALEMLAMWVLMPISGILFGSLAAIDAETRLMFGKYLGFHVTSKQRRSTVTSSGVEAVAINRVD